MVHGDANPGERALSSVGDVDSSGTAMAHISKLHGICGFAALLAFAGCNSPSTSGGSSDGDVRSDLTAVTVVTPEQTALTRSTTQPAIVHAYQTADVYAKVSGYLKTLSADIGTRVKAEAPLATLSVPELAKQLERQRQLVLQREANETRAAASVTLANADVTAAKAARDEAESHLDAFDAELAARESEFRRFTSLVENRSVAESLLDEATERRDSAKAKLAAAESSVATAKANVTVSEAKLAAANAEVKAAAAETEVERKRVEELDAMMGYATLTAPFAGVVTARHVDPGDLVRNAQTTESDRPPLFIVEDIDTVRVHVAIPEKDAPWVDTDEEPGDGKGDAVSLRFKAFGGKPINGTVTRHTYRLDDATRSLEVEIVLDNENHRLLPGMYGEATIDLETKSNAMVLPATAVRHDETGRAYVYVVGKDDTVQVVDVTTGLDDGKQIEITSDLDPKSRVVDAIIGRLQPGQKVRVN